MSDPKPSPLELAEAKRAARKAASSAEHDAQRAADLEAIDALEVELGDTNVAVVNVPFTPGLPTCVAARCPKPVEVKRYRSRVKPKPNGKGEIDYVGAAEELAAVCQVFPSAELYAKICDARPGLHLQLGLAALKLATGSEESEGKD